ncbi:class I SAM-dependent methyltransferase [Povalibacter sp.]|uniref:class I SAM-dependent methyltransferase n=1 Tax=Povalibacter sp. TaxID=1962978 RepID=UPI002F3F6032
MDAKLQRRIQRYGWDLAVRDYEALWQAQLSDAHTALLQMAAFAPGDRVLDVACGTGLITFEAARAVGPRGEVVGIDLSGAMVHAAQQRAEEQELSNVAFAQMDAEALHFPKGRFDTALCALGLMYVPDPLQSLREMRRVLRPGGRIVLAVWGRRAHCGWASVFPIVADEVSSDVCPLFFDLGNADALTRLCADASFQIREERRIATELRYPDAEHACNAMFIGGPVALAWSRFDEPTRQRVRAAYARSIEGARSGCGYAIPAEFVVVSAEVTDE